ncbi:hypothetical protein SERLA73DRAFT_186503 [Serpula lacrymans var. lacrymans S7.3]|uniref:Enoyl reductase (ER) domain-containing protein n=2 Tax=Serpula lacrymans var. lacrymans TaxID=341189 RepID=F8Q7D6_SERL3|nr:uncharacterized protein SERLADRAFT_475592 [Serpula lacrymans var. lacrymans S7.9]EGN95474.1 hypothetical protein SERLA73DRAFT_186503 [Serpula lacrymans var. lacrymans S7.3]EGO21003.1 hypothetical protein SERLADRAFT_475592 [Serpula lacrymans var. lacrymans S7.9]
MASQLTSSQRAWTAVKRGSPAKALALQDVPIPSKLVEGEVLVKVQAAALNPVGYKLMGTLPNFIARRPITVEHDLAGVIVDANGSEFSIGDEIIGFIPVQLQLKTRQGAITEYTRLPASNVTIRPPNITPTDACGIPLAGETAMQSLFDVGKLEPGQTVFINGGSSSVGAFAIQIAKARGCKVVASASGKNEDFVKSLGVDDFLDYTKAPIHKQLEDNPPSPKYHLIVDAVGLVNPSLYTHSEAYLAPGGVFVSTGPLPSFSWKGISDIVSTINEVFLRPSWLGGTKRTWKLVNVVHKKEDLYSLRDLLADGKLKPVVDSIFSFEDTLKAYDRIKTQRAKGKVVIRVDPKAD